jgi:plastocyanin
LVLTVALAAGCGSPASDSASKQAGTPAGGAAKGQPVTVEVELKDNFFEPTEITVDRGQQVNFTVKNEGQAIHNMHILSSVAEGKDYASNPTVQPSESSQFSATFTKAGTLKFQCDYHLPDMVGNITVR